MVVVGLQLDMKVAVYPGNVLTLHMSKPQGFKYKSGQYMFVNCAAVSPFEWYVARSLTRCRFDVVFISEFDIVTEKNIFN